MALEAHRHERAQGLSRSRPGSARRRSPARPSCCTPSRGWATRCMFARYVPLLARMGAQDRAGGAARAARRCSPGSTASPTIVGARRDAAAPSTCIARWQPAARLQDRARRHSGRHPLSPRAGSRASRAGGRAWRRCRRRASRWPGRAAPATSNDRNRSLSLSQLEPLLSRAGRAASSACSATCATPTPSGSRAKPASCISAIELDDFADTAAVLALCDLVDLRRHLGRACGRRARPAGLRAAAVPAGLALDARSRALALVSGDQAVPAARDRRLGGVIGRVRAALAAAFPAKSH